MQTIDSKKSVFSSAYWLDAASQLKNVRMLCVAAIFIALRVALKSTFIPVGDNLNIYFGYFVNALGAMIYGPVVALVSAAATDTLGFFVAQSGQGAYFFPFIFVEMAGSLIYALFLWRRKLTGTRVILSKFSVTLFVNILLNPLIMIWSYEFFNNGKSYAFITIPRVMKNVALFPIEAFLLATFLALAVPVISKTGFIPKLESDIKLEKKHILLLGILFVVACAVVAAYYFLYLPNKK